MVYGLSVPFRVDDLKKRYKKVKESDVSPFKLNEIVAQLWQSGIVGVEIVPKSEQIVNSFIHVLGREGFRQYNLSGGKKLYRWYFFEYNFDGKPNELMKRYEHTEEADARLVLHPSTFEYLLPNVYRVCPIGA